MACFFFEGTRTARASRPYHKKNNFPPGRGQSPRRPDRLPFPAKKHRLGKLSHGGADGASGFRLEEAFRGGAAEFEFLRGIAELEFEAGPVGHP